MKILKLNTELTSLEDALAIAKNWYSQKKGEIIPTMISYTKDNRMMIVGLPHLGNRHDGSREQTLEFAKTINALFDVRIYVLLHECWMIEATNLEDTREWIGRIKEHPEAKEKLSITVCSNIKKRNVLYDIMDGQLENEIKSEGMTGDLTELLSLKIPEYYKAKMKQDFINHFKIEF